MACTTTTWLSCHFCITFLAAPSLASSTWPLSHGVSVCVSVCLFYGSLYYHLWLPVINLYLGHWEGCVCFSPFCGDSYYQCTRRSNLTSFRVYTQVSVSELSIIYPDYHLIFDLFSQCSFSEKGKSVSVVFKLKFFDASW